MEFVEQLKSQVDIVQVIGESVRLRRVGAGPRYVGLCPFHNEKTPSFSVHAQHQFYKCFGCGAGGDVIKFVMEIDSLPFWEAVKYLAERNGIPLPKRSEAADEETRQRGVLYEMHEIALEHYRQNLFGPSGEETRQYLARRGVSKAAAEEFGLGLSERGGQALTRLLQRRNYAPGDLEASCLVLLRNDGSGYFDRFRNRLMFPIHSEMGKVIGFGGRALGEGEEPKYLNSSETPIYRKSHVLYNLNRARKAVQEEGFGVLVEGYMDVIGVYAAGVRNVVATCGTALTAAQVRSLKRHAPAVVVNFDPDNAGAQATERSSQVLLEEGMRLRVLHLSGGLDPDEYIKEYGAEKYLDVLRNAGGYFHWLADRARGRFDARTPEGKVSIFQYLLPAIHRMPDKIERLSVANDLADYMGIEAGMVLDEFRKAAAERREQKNRAREESVLDPNEVLLLHALMTSAEARAELAPALRTMEGVRRFRSARVFDTILRLVESGAEVNLSAVEGRLEEADRALLLGVLFNDELLRDGVTMEQAAACVRRLSAGEHRLGRDHLRQLIKNAEKSGDMAEALRLMSELRELEREG
jgi:DNA primase